MQQSTRLRLLHLVFALATIVLIGAPSAAQVAHVKLKGKVDQLWRTQAYYVSSGVEATLYTVPPDRQLVVTDVIVTNANGSPAVARLRGDGVIELNLAVPSSSTFAHAFGTGIVFGPGEEVRALATSAGQLQFHLTGYLMKVR